MSVLLVGTGGLFTRLGKLAKLLSDARTFQGTTLVTDVTNIVNQFTGADEGLIDGIAPQLIATQFGAGTLLPFLQSVAINTVNTMVFNDNPLLSMNDISISLAEVIRQMKLSSDSVKKCTLGTTVTPYGSNQGNGVVLATTYRYDGLQQENLFAENITLSVTGDAETNSALANNETFRVAGTVAERNSLAFDWPLGSGASSTLSAINGGASNTQGNILTNGDFETFTVANVPDGFVIATGSAGTTVKQSVAQHYTGASSLNFVGNGAELTSVTQQFGSSTGTLGNLSFLSLYALNAWIKMDVVPAAGILEFALVDGSGTIINDYQGNPNSFTKDLTTATTGFLPINGVFRTPYVMPAVVKLRVRLSTALTNTRNLYIDRLALGTMANLYKGGPSLAAFSGSSQFFYPDYFTVATTNNRGGASNINTMQSVADRFFNMKGLDLMFPSNASPTIADSLIS